MKQKILNNISLITGIILGCIAIFSMFGFGISPAVTQSQYEIDKLKSQRELESIERDIGEAMKKAKEAFCFALEAKIQYLENEKFKYNHVDEIAIEAKQVGDYLENSKNAARSLMMVSQQLGKLKKLSEKEGC